MPKTKQPRTFITNKPQLQITTTLDADYRAYCEKMGNGTVSKGIRFLVDFHKQAQAHPARAAESEGQTK